MQVHELREAVQDEDSVTTPGSVPSSTPIAPQSRVTLQVRGLARSDAAQIAGIIRVWELLPANKRVLLADFARLLGSGS